MSLTRKHVFGIPVPVSDDGLCRRITRYFQAPGMQQKNARQVAMILGFREERVLKVMRRMLASNMLQRPATYSSRTPRQLSITDNLELHPNYRANKRKREAEFQ